MTEGTRTDLHTRSKNVILFTIATAFIGFAFITTESVINNYYDSFGISAVQRGWLEVPRELPGLTLAIISGILFFLGSAKMAVIACTAGALGLIGFGFLTPSYAVMLLWLFVFNVGTHVWMPVRADIGMALAKDGNTGSQLGRFDMVNTFAGLLGGSLILFGLVRLGFDFSTIFLILGLFLITAVLFLSRLSVHVPKKREKIKLVFKRRFMLYYLMCMLYGARKQISITFIPWVLIRIFESGADRMLIIGMITSALGIAVYPLIGRCIDRFGEKTVLAGEALVLAAVCLLYIFVRGNGEWILFVMIGACVADRLAAYAGNARSTYVHKIAEHKEDVLPTISAGISIDHVVSMIVPIIGGYVWYTFGYQAVFFGALFIALGNFTLASRIKPNHT